MHISCQFFFTYPHMTLCGLFSTTGNNSNTTRIPCLAKQSRQHGRYMQRGCIFPAVLWYVIITKTFIIYLSLQMFPLKQLFYSIVFLIRFFILAQFILGRGLSLTWGEAEGQYDRPRLITGPIWKYLINDNFINKLTSICIHFVFIWGGFIFICAGFVFIWGGFIIICGGICLYMACMGWIYLYMRWIFLHQYSSLYAVYVFIWAVQTSLYMLYKSYDVPLGLSFNYRSFAFST